MRLIRLLLSLSACVCAIVRTTKILGQQNKVDWSCKYFYLALWKEIKSVSGTEAELDIWAAYVLVAFLLICRHFHTILSLCRAEMNVIVICACVPMLLPLARQLTGQKNYLSRRRPGPEAQNIQLEGMVRTVAVHHEGREGSVAEGEILTTTELPTQWEAV